MKRRRRVPISRPSPAMIVAIAALVMASIGTGYALTIPKNSVGPKQLRNGAVVEKKIKNGAVTAAKVRKGSLLADRFKAGQLPEAASARIGGSSGFTSTSGNGAVATLANVSLPEAGAYTFMADGFAYASPVNNAPDQTICSLRASGDQVVAGMPSQMTGSDVGTRLIVIGAANVDQSGTVSMRCTQVVQDGNPDTINYIGGRIVVTKVASLAAE